MILTVETSQPTKEDILFCNYRKVDEFLSYEEVQGSISTISQSIKTMQKYCKIQGMPLPSYLKTNKSEVGLFLIFQSQGRRYYIYDFDLNNWSVSLDMLYQNLKQESDCNIHYGEKMFATSS